MIDIFICIISETGQLGSMKINKTEGEGGKYPEKDKRAKRQIGATEHVQKRGAGVH